MRIGKLRHRVTIQRPADELDPLGAPVGWIDVATVWASIEPLRGREFWAAQQVNAEQTVKVGIRYRPGVTSAMRVLHGSRIFELVAPPIDPENRHRELVLHCREVA